MTVSVSFTAVPTALAGLSISGVQIKDIDKIPVQGLEMICPVLFPDPAGWVDNISVERESFGISGAGKYDLVYTLHYIYLHSPAGGNISDLDNYNAMIVKLGLICTELGNNDTLGSVNDVTLESVSALGYIEAPDGIVFNGCRIALRVLQFT